MTRFIIPILLIILSIGVFFVFVTAQYEKVKSLKKEVAAYDNALNNSKTLENARDKIVTKANSIKVENLEKIKKMLPDNIDNIRLILEIQELASPYGMELKDVRYDNVEKKSEKDGKDEEKEEVVQAGVSNKDFNKDYGVWNLEFKTEGSYANFINLTKDIEKNLRLVDIASVEFSSATSLSKKDIDFYGYTFKIKTYWLKN